jgi:hypothetical protein
MHCSGCAGGQALLQLLSQRTSRHFRTTYIPVIGRAWGDDDSSRLIGSSDPECGRRTLQWSVVHQAFARQADAVDVAPRLPYVTAGILAFWCLSVNERHFDEVFRFVLPIMYTRLAFTGLGCGLRCLQARSLEKQATLAADWAVVWSSSSVLEALPSAHVHALCSISDEAFRTALPDLENS